MIMIGPNSLSVVVLRRKNWWVAQCLEYDIAAQAEDLNELPYELHRLLVGRMVASKEVGIDPFERLPAAPHEYWEMFEKARLTLQAEKLPFRIPAGLPYLPQIPELKLALQTA